MGLYALLALLAVMVLDLIRPRSRRAWGIGAIATVALGAIVLFSPWAVKNWIFTGNPLYPQFYGLFGGADWSEEFARQWREWIFHLGPGRSLLDFLLLPWRLTFHSSPFYADFAGDLSPILFPAVIVALLMPSLWPRLRPALLVSLIYLVLWFLSSQQMRFLIPCFALLAAAGGAGMARALESKSRNGLWGGVLAAVIFATAWFLHPTPLSIADANFTVTFGRPPCHGSRRLPLPSPRSG